MSNRVPEGWSYEQLGNYISESVAGEWGSEAAGDENDIPVLRSTNFTASGIIDFSKLAYRNIEEKKRLAKSLKYGDIVLEKSGGSPTQPVGRVVYFDKSEPFLFSNFTQKLSPSNSVDSKFLFYKLYSEYQNGTVMKFQQQTTGIINFQLAEYLGFKSSFPPLPEQQKIATILSSVDDVIEKTRAQINKLKDLKTGMMQELLTKGIGHTEFKDSPVGRIPVEWNAARLSEVFTLNYGKSPKDIISDRGSNPVWGTGGKTAKTDAFLYDGESIVLGRKGTIDQPRYVSGKFWVIDTAYYSTKHDDNCVRFLHYLLQNINLKAFNEASGVPSLSRETLYSVALALPPPLEQKKIADIVYSIERKILAAENKYQALCKTKKALMQDLLTGKVRVNPVSIESI